MSEELALKEANELSQDRLGSEWMADWMIEWQECALFNIILFLMENNISIITWCFSDRASWIDCILITNFDALIIIYS